MEKPIKQDFIIMNSQKSDQFGNIDDQMRKLTKKLRIKPF